MKLAIVAVICLLILLFVAPVIGARKGSFSSVFSLSVVRIDDELQIRGPDSPLTPIGAIIIKVDVSRRGLFGLLDEYRVETKIMVWDGGFDGYDGSRTLLWRQAAESTRASWGMSQPKPSSSIPLVDAERCLLLIRQGGGRLGYPDIVGILLVFACMVLLCIGCFAFKDLPRRIYLKSRAELYKHFGRSVCTRCGYELIEGQSRCSECGWEVN